MSEQSEIDKLKASIADLREEIDVIKRALAGFRISVSPAYGNQWLAIPPAPGREQE